MDNLERLRHKPEYYKHDGPEWVRNICPTLNSFSWHIKDNREFLMSQGALVRLGRDYFVDVERFPKAFADVLAAKAKGGGRG